MCVSWGETSAATLHSRRLTLVDGDVQVVRGIPVLSLRRTLADLAGVLRPDALVCAIDAALHRGLVTPTELDLMVQRRTWCPYVVTFRSAVLLSDAGVESAHETLTRLLLKPVLPGLRSQVELFDAAMRPLARLDLGDETLRLGVESDGAAYHGGRAAADRRRDYRTNWTIERCSWFETRCEQHQLKNRVLQTARRLGWPA